MMCLEFDEINGCPALRQLGFIDPVQIEKSAEGFSWHWKSPMVLSPVIFDFSNSQVLVEYFRGRKQGGLIGHGGVSKINDFDFGNGCAGHGGLIEY